MESSELPAFSVCILNDLMLSVRIVFRFYAYLNRLKGNREINLNEPFDGYYILSAFKRQAHTRTHTTWQMKFMANDWLTNRSLRSKLV